MKDTSILILTHNAPKYVEETLTTLNGVTSPESLGRCEIIVLDNASDKETRELLRSLKEKDYIDKLEFSEENTFFARGNNLAAAMAMPDARYYLLLNSDVSIRDPEWLDKLFAYKNSGRYAAAAYGMCSGPDRADGYCFLVDREIYDMFGLDEDFQWWGAVTKLQCEMLKAGYSILAVDNHDRAIYHYGGKSGRDFKKARQANTDPSEVMAVFASGPGKLIVENMAAPGVFDTVRKKIKKVLTRIKRI